MSATEIIKQAAVQATNDLMRDNGLPPVLPDDAYSKIHSAALTAYQQNAGEHANAWKLLEDIGRKAAMLDELLPAIKAYINTDRYTAEHSRAFNDVLHLIQRAGDLK